MSILSVKDLSVTFDTRRGPLLAVDCVSFDLQPGKVLGIVGESGSGKSVTSLALMGLLASTAKISTGEILFGGRDLVKLDETEMQKIRGAEIAMIFQDPMTSLNPSYTVGFQIMETLRLHEPGTKAERKQKAIELLKQVGIPEAESRLESFPHELSGGMSQRVMIAMAIACSPKLLIADEPTTALDVTIQAQILALLKRLQRERGMSLILVTHDMGVVSQMADDIMVMYAGQAVERGTAQQIIQNPRHPYTAALLECLPARHGLHEFRTRLPTITGLVPDLLNRPTGCQLNPRCGIADDNCKTAIPEERGIDTVRVKCFKPLENKSASKM